MLWGRGGEVVWPCDQENFPRSAARSPRCPEPIVSLSDSSCIPILPFAGSILSFVAEAECPRRSFKISARLQSRDAAKDLFHKLIGDKPFSILVYRHGGAIVTCLQCELLAPVGNGNLD